MCGFIIFLKLVYYMQKLLQFINQNIEKENKKFISRVKETPLLLKTAITFFGVRTKYTCIIYITVNNMFMRINEY